MKICYSGKSAISAKAISEESDSIQAVRSSVGDVNWGRARANTKLNPDTSNATNKRRMRQLFRDNEVPMPRLIDDITHATQFPIVGRPDQHMKGRGFWLCNSLEDVVKALKGTKKKKGATHFMEYINAPREYRVHIFMGKSIRISEKDHTAFHTYTTRKPQHSVKHVRNAAKQAVKALGLDFGAVDILANDDQAWVLEVNSAPGIGGSMPRVYAQKFEEWYEQA